MTTSTTTGAGASAEDPTKRTARQEAAKAGETIREEAGAVAEQARALGREHAERQFEHGKGVVEEQVDAVGAAVDDAAERLRAENHPLAGYADELSGQLSRLSRGIQESSLDDLAYRTRRLARENPGLFMLGSVAVGFAAARFFKASAGRDHERDDYAFPYGERAYGERDRTGYGGSVHGRGDDTAYRSPTASAPAPYRDAASTTATEPSARVPMDSETVAASTAGGSTAGIGSPSDSASVGTTASAAHGSTPHGSTTTASGDKKG